MSTSSALLRGAFLSLVIATFSNVHLDAQVRSARRAQARSTNQSLPCNDASDNCFFHHTGFFVGQGQTTDVAGNSAMMVATLPFQTQPAIGQKIMWGNNIRAVTLGERGDEPCFVQVQGTESMEEWEDCGGGGPRSTRVASIDGPQALVGIRVCNNNRSGVRGQLVKGIELRWVKRPHEGVYADRISQVDQADQPNCSQWRPWVHCPMGTAAQTLLVHHVRVGGRRGAVGFQSNYSSEMIVCRKTE